MSTESARIPLAPTRGLNEDENPTVLEPGELSKAQNVWLRGSTPATRPGIEAEPNDYSDPTTGGNAVHGLHEFRWNRDANRELIAVAGGEVFTDDTTTLTKTGVTISSGSTNKWTFAIHKDTLYAAGGSDGDSVWKYTGGGSALSAVTFQDASSTDIDAKYVWQKWNYGFLAGMNGTRTDDNPMIVRYSALNDMDTWPAGNTIGGDSAIGGFPAHGDEFITGFADFIDNRGDWLLVLTNKRVHPILQREDPFSPFVIHPGGVVANGCVHQNAFVSLGVDSGDAVYLSSQGIHSLRQSQAHGTAADTYLSWKIRNTFRGINFARIDQAEGAYWKEEGLVLFAVPTGSSTTNDTVLALDVKGVDDLTAETAKWFVWTPADLAANVLRSARSGGSEDRWHVYVGTNSGNVARFSRSVFSDLGSAYTASWRTRHSDLNQPGVTKQVRTVYSFLQPGGSYEPEMKLIYDYGASPGETHFLRMPVESPLYGSAIYGQSRYASENNTIRYKQSTAGEGEVVALEFSHARADEEFRIARSILELDLAGDVLGDVESI